MRRGRAGLCLPLGVLLCLAPFLLGATTSTGLERLPSSQPVPPPLSSLVKGLLTLRSSLTEGSQPVFPAPPGYRLPWAPGLSHAVAQAPGEAPTHQSLYAWDFDLGYELVLAARGGRVSMVRDGESMGGCDSAFGGRANYILIDHGDGTSGLYLHIDYEGALVQEGALVAQGDAIAYSGSSGLSCGDGGWAGPHLHFQVERTVPGDRSNETVPITFDEVEGRYAADRREVCVGQPAAEPSRSRPRAHLPQPGRPRRGGLRAAVAQFPGAARHPSHRDTWPAQCAAASADADRDADAGAYLVVRGEGGDPCAEETRSSSAAGDTRPQEPAAGSRYTRRHAYAHQLTSA